MYSQSGSFDTTFGGGDGIAEGIQGQLNDMILQADGKIIGIGNYVSTSENNKFMIARFMPDGSIDNDFGTSGSAIAVYGVKSGASAAALQPDGKIVAVGYTSDAAGNSSNFDIMVVRYNADGTLDTDFNGTGIKVLPYAGGDSANAVGIQEDGRIVIGSKKNTIFTIFRLLPDGELDMTFNEVGYVSFDSNYIGEAFTLKVLDNGKILAGGRIQDKLTIARLNADGTPDLDFGISNGMQKITELEGIGILYNMLVLDNGDFIVAGGAIMGQKYNGVLAKFNSEGMFVESFGDNGVLIADMGTGISSQARDIVLSDDKLVVTYGAGPISNYDINVRVYDLNGVPDISFANNGSLTFYFNANYHEYVKSLVAQPDGKILVGVEGGFKIVRLLMDDENMGVKDFDNKSMFTVYPNPVNENTQLQMDLKEGGEITVKLYDVSGKLMEVLVNNKSYAPGKTNVPLMLPKLSHGVYFLDVTNSGKKENTIRIVY